MIHVAPLSPIRLRPYNVSARACLPSLAHLGVAVLDDAQLHTVALGQRNPWLAAFANHEHVLQPRRESVTDGILDVDDLEGTRVALTMHDDAHTAHVVSAAYHDGVSCLELHVVEDLVGRQIHPDRVVDLDIR